MSEPTTVTPEFNEACLAILNSWRGGKLPFSEALARLLVMVQQASASGNRANQARAEQILANLQLTRGNLDASIQHAQHARMLATPYNDHNRLAVIDLVEGENWRYKGEFDTAIRLYRSAYDHANQLTDLGLKAYLQSFSAVNIGLVLLAMDRTDEAQIEFETGLSLAQQWDRPDASLVTLCEIHHGMAMIHLKHNRLLQAWEEALKAYHLANQNDDPRISGLANRTMGNVLTVYTPPDSTYSHDPDDYFRTSIEKFRLLDVEVEIMRTTFAQAVSLAKRGNINSATRKLQQVIIAFKRLGMIDDLQQALNFRKTILS